MERAVIIGSGNLAEALARAVTKSGLKLVQLFARNAARGQQVAALAGTHGPRTRPGWPKPTST